MSKPPTAFFDNERVSHAALREGQRTGTRQRIVARQEQAVLLVQDSTSFDFSHLPHTTA